MPPPERLYSLPQALPYVPFPTLQALRSWLTRHASEFPPRYRHRHRSPNRYLTASELSRIQALTLRTRLHLPRVKPLG